MSGRGKNGRWIVRIQGGLGNQMFQYACAYSRALETGADLALDLGWFENSKTDTRRHFELGIFGIRNPATEKAEINEILADERKPLNRVLQKLRRFGLPLSPGRIIRERHFHFDPGVLAARLPAYLDGYFQSEKYFARQTQKIREVFRFPPLDEKNSGMASEIGSCRSVSLHIRRGDYVGNPMHGGICTPAYYREAIRMMAEKLGDPVFFVFSDDPEWVASEFRTEHPLRIIGWNAGENSYRDMQLMSLCGHHILANSSFSWWGAWLNPSPDKTVIAPSRWFNEPGMDTSDLIPSGWIRIAS